MVGMVLPASSVGAGAGPRAAGEGAVGQPVHRQSKNQVLGFRRCRRVDALSRCRRLPLRAPQDASAGLAHLPTTAKTTMGLGRGARLKLGKRWPGFTSASREPPWLTAVCVSVQVCARVSVYARVCAFVCDRLCTCASMCVSTCVCMCMYACVLECMCIRACVCLCVLVCVLVYASMHVCFQLCVNAIQIPGIRLAEFKLGWKKQEDSEVAPSHPAACLAIGAELGTKASRGSACADSLPSWCEGSGPH